MQPRGDLQLALGYWIVSHREQLRKWWVLLLLGFIVSALSWTITFTAIFFNRQPAADAQLGQRAGLIGAFKPLASTLPDQPTITDVTVISRGADRVDVVGMVTNPNADWGLKSAAVTFTVGDQELSPLNVFLNPGATRPVMQQNVAVPATAGRQATAVISAIVWAQATTASFPDPVFNVTEVSLTPTTVKTGAQSFLTVNLQAQITNRSVYSFLAVEVPVVVKNAGRIVAVDQLTINRWATLETKPLNHTWSFPISQTTSAEIAPQVSRFDANNLYR